MPSPTAITSLTSVAASNGPDGATELPSVLDDYQRAHAALFKRSLSIGASISATATLAVPDDYGYFEVMGSGEVVAIDDAASWNGREVTFRFSAATTLSHSTNLALPLAQQLVTEAGGFAKFIRRTVGVWECVSYERRTAGPEVFSTLDVRGQASFSGTMNVGGPITAASTLDVRGPASLSASLNVGGPLQVAGALDVHGPASFSGSLMVGGNLNVNGPTSLSASLNVGGPVTFGGPLQVSGALDAHGPASFSATLNAGGPLFARGTFDVSGNASFSASLNVGGPLLVGGRLDVRGTASFSATVTALKFVAQTELVAASFSGAAVASQAQMEAGSTIGALVSPGRQQFHPSSVKFWIEFDGTGTPAAGASYNLDSITDNGVGNYTLNFTTAFSTTSFCAIANMLNVSALLENALIEARAAGSVQVRTFRATGTGDTNKTAEDVVDVYCACWGDQ